MNIKILIFILLATGSPVISYADINRNNPSAYGIGILTCPYANFMIGSECFRNLSWLKEPIRLYEEPKENARITGTILDPDEKLHGWQPFHFWEVGGEKKLLDVVEVSYEEKAIVIYERKGQWLRAGKGWLKGDDIKLNGSSVFLSWDTVLGYQLHGYMEMNRAYIGWFYPISDQYMLEKPNGKRLGLFWDSSNRETLPDLLVLKRQENWVKVVVDNKGTACGNRDKTPDGPTGWIRLINKYRNPLVYWYTRGC